MVFSHASKDQRDEASQPQQDSAFHDKWYSFHMGIHCLHQAIIIGLHDAIWRAKLESNDYPLLQHSKVKLIDICIHTMLRT
jgi:hypothetical protein